MKRAAVFFDRDNTLIANDGYLGDPNGVVLVHGAADAIARARALGYAIVVFSNQSGVARGMFTEEAVHAVNQRLDEMLLDENPHAVIDRHEFCPYHRDATVERYRQDSDLRKPKPGMILQAERQLALDLPRSWVIGDAPRDIDAGKAAGCRTILLHNPELSASPTSLHIGESQADFAVRSLGEAMEVISRSAADDLSTTSPEASAGLPPVEPIPMPAQPEESASEPEAAEVETSHLPTTAATSESSSEPTGDDTSDPAPIIARPTAQVRGKSRSDILLGQILEELRRSTEHPASDFSVSKLLAGVVQVLALAAIFLAYLKVKDPETAVLFLLAGIFLQVFTIALLIMGKQK